MLSNTAPEPTDNTGKTASEGDSVEKKKCVLNSSKVLSQVRQREFSVNTLKRASNAAEPKLTYQSVQLMFGKCVMQSWARRNA